MLPTDLQLAELCAAAYQDTSVFGYVDGGAQSGVWVAVKQLPEYDVVVFRGSDDMLDWRRDFAAAMVNLPMLGNVHFGFSENIWMARQSVLPRLRPGTKTCFAGHSLGGPRALYLSRLLPVSVDKIAVFGCPRPGDQAFVDLFKDDNLSAYRNTMDDPVPDVPLVLPDFPFADIRTHPTMLDGHAPSPWIDVLKRHHIQSYLDGLRKLCA